MMASLKKEEAALKVAIIGGGIAGLSCAQHLSSAAAVAGDAASLDVTVFDTGRLRPGGRCSSRLPGDPPSSSRVVGTKSRDTILGNAVIDHAAQILVVPSETSSRNNNKQQGTKESDAFAEQIRQWESEGIVTRFDTGEVCEILPPRTNNSNNNKQSQQQQQQQQQKQKQPPFRIRPISDRLLYKGSPQHGMYSIPLAMIQNRSYTIHQDVWISPSNGAQFLGTSSDEKKENNSTDKLTLTPKWKLRAKGLDLGTFDRIVIAHNGKCADRLMSRSPARSLHSLLRTDFKPTVPAWGGKRMTLNSIYSLTIAIPTSDTNHNNNNDTPSTILSQTLGTNVSCAFIKNEPSLRFLTCQTHKNAGRAMMNPRFEIWTILSSPKFASAHKAPQENLPPDLVQNVTHTLLRSLETSLDLEPQSLIPKETRLQLWGAAVPLNVWKAVSTTTVEEDEKKKKEDENSEERSGFLYDHEHGVGACGDWLLDPSIAGAWESGRRLAHWMIQTRTTTTTEQRQQSDNWSVGLPHKNKKKGGGGGGSFQASRTASAAGIGNVR